MKLLITGGTGYLGGRLAQFFDHETNYHLFLGTREVSEDITPNERIKFVETCWASQAQLSEICEGIDAVIHLAGMNAGDCAKATQNQLEEDVKQTRRLLSAAIDKGVKRFIYLSTAHVYSSNLEGTIDENTPTLNEHPYATNHIAKENLVRKAHENGDIEGVVIRLSNAFGAPVSEKVNCWMLLINDLCRQATISSEMVLKSTGQQRRDFIAITDVCIAIQHLLEISRDLIGDGLFNLGGRFSPTVLEITKNIANKFYECSGNKPEIIYAKVDDKKTTELNFQIKKILDSGYLPSNKIDTEIYELISFCRSYMK